MHHIAVDRAGLHDRDLKRRDRSMRVGGFSRGSMDMCVRLSIWKVPIVSTLRIVA